MTQFFIIAWLPQQDHHKRVVIRANTRKVVRFTCYQKAWDWCCDYLAPDWEWLVIPMETVEIYDFPKEFPNAES